MKLIRVSVSFLLAGLFIIGASATAWTTPTQSWVTDPATGCKIGWVHETSTLISASWSGPMVAGKAQGKGNLSLTVKGTDGKELQGQGQAEMLAGLLHGKAALKWSSGDSYDGYYKASLKEGKGIYKFADGRIQDGEWKNNKMEGHGVFKDAAGKIIYEGEWKAGLQEGKGIGKFADGRIYDGQWKAGLKEGKGIGKFADGRIYDGQWKNDMPEGRGTFKWPDGNVYTGAYKNGVRDGHGVLKDAADKIIYAGEWKDDKPVTQPAQPKVISDNVTAGATQSWVADPATGCKIGWVHEQSTLISASWSGPMVAGKAQGKGNLSLTIKGTDGKELQGQGEAEMIAGLLDGKATIKWSDGNSYDGYYKAGLKEGKGIYKFADGRIYDGQWKAGLREGKGIYKWADGSSYDGEWKNDKREGHGVLKDAAGKITNEGEWRNDRLITWVADPARGCKIGWFSGNFTLISARWSGPMVAGKAQGKGNLSLTMRDKDGKELQYQGQAEMLAGLLDGKVAMKWSDGESYDGYYKAGLRQGRGIFKFADGRIYNGAWKADLQEGTGTFKWPDGTVYDGEWKNSRPEGTGTFKWPNGNVYTGAYKNGVREGHGVLKDAAGKIIYAGEWKDDKSLSQPKTDKVLDIPWGASEDEAKRIMRQRPQTSFFAADTDKDIKLHTWYTYLGYFNDNKAKLQVHFYQGKMFGVYAGVYTSEDQLLDKFNSVKQGLTQRYGPPLGEQGKYLDAYAWWDLGGDYRVVIWISKSTNYENLPFEIAISYRNQVTQDVINKAGAPASGKDF